jgi:hypothetical protein
MGSAGHVVHSSASGTRNIDMLFFLLEWYRYGLQKKRVGTSYIELVVLHPVASADHEVHSGASGGRNVGALYFMLECDWCSFHKKRVRTTYVELVFLHPVG